MSCLEQEHRCSICYIPQEHDATDILRHVQSAHTDSDMFREFVDGLVVRQYCGRCGRPFWSDVSVLNESLFAARPCCPDCRRDSRPLRDLLTDHMDARELVSRALVRPDLARQSHEEVDRSE